MSYGNFKISDETMKVFIFIKKNVMAMNYDVCFISFYE